MPLICECADERCMRVITMPLDEYVAVRDRGGRFVLVPGHERAGERLVARNDRFAVVEAGDPLARGDR